VSYLRAQNNGRRGLLLCQPDNKIISVFIIDQGFNEVSPTIDRTIKADFNSLHFDRQNLAFQLIGFNLGAYLAQCGKYHKFQ
jgi:hypothetical protein